MVITKQEGEREYVFLTGWVGKGHDDLMRGKPSERPQTDENIAAVPFSDQDPLLGKRNGLLKIWK